MKLIDAIKEQHGRPFTIPDCSRDELPECFKQMGYKTGTEVGVYKGAFTEKFCKAGLKMYAIDPWKAYQGAGRTQQEQARQDFLYGHTQRTLAPYKDCTIIRKTSMDALNDFGPGSLDFVYLDGDHRFPYVAQDIYEWSEKVKNGGVVSGHDYFCTDPRAKNVLCQVGAIVDAYVSAFGIENFYVFGRSKSLELEAKDDRYLSWMWIKPL
ncbi:hypothetical protein A2394_00215 [Candidatus Woesebacteria bacterium RIFOXYB1_FULL_42_36]|nr:MAG: hypothetical protein A2394_00215 [Candidatus Woesebacteria bacterium RIFOXYB1_FULL_42_36]